MAIDKDKAKDNLFGNLKKPAKQEPPAHQAVIELPCEPEQVTAPMPASIAKFMTFDKVTALLPAEQKEQLDRIARRMMKQRTHAAKKGNSERITTNTVLRALISNFLECEDLFDHDVLYTESDVQAWIKKMFKV